MRLDDFRGSSSGQVIEWRPTLALPTPQNSELPIHYGNWNSTSMEVPSALATFTLDTSGWPMRCRVMPCLGETRQRKPALVGAVEYRWRVPLWVDGADPVSGLGMQECCWWDGGVEGVDSLSPTLDGLRTEVPPVYRDPRGSIDEGRVVTDLFPPELRSFVVTFVAEAISYGIGHSILMSGFVRTLAAIPAINDFLRTSKGFEDEDFG